LVAHLGAGAPDWAVAGLRDPAGHPGRIRFRESALFLTAPVAAEKVFATPQLTLPATAGVMQSAASGVTAAATLNANLTIEDAEKAVEAASPN
jgi:hypothetical protein